MFTKSFFTFALLYVIYYTTTNAQENTSCQTPDQTSGLCISIKSCRVLFELVLTQSSNPTVVNYLRRSTCGYDGPLPLVCCPQANAKSNPDLEPVDGGTDSNENNNNNNGNSNNNNNNNNNPSGYNFLKPPNCGYSQAGTPRVVNGIPAKLGEFPWLVALGYRNTNNANQPKYLCGGSLITNRHILTAGHCVHNRRDLYMARVGDLDLYDDNDGATPENIPLVRAKIHENYSPVTFTNDIAILTMERPYNNPKIMPVCLPFQEPLRSNTFLKYQPTVAGWGAIYFRGPSSSILQQAVIPIVSNDNCKRAYANKSVIDDRIICAGLASGEKDACQGDSGGPFMYGMSEQRNVRFYQIGIVSYGFRCAEPGYPGVYTRVTNFIDWIGRNLN